MLKEERQEYILKKIKKEGIVRISDVSQELDVTEMTIRRDLKDIEKNKSIKRVHGGAKYIDSIRRGEINHSKKININYDLKVQIAKKVADLIEEDDIIFVGPGSTLELLGDNLKNKKCKIITNSLFLYNKIYNIKTIDLVLIGGSIRSNTGSFVGDFANAILKNLHFKKAFIGANGINNGEVYTHNEKEGYIQQSAFDNSDKKYLVADHTKIGIEDFFAFYNLDEITSLISDDKIERHISQNISEYTQVI